MSIHTSSAEAHRKAAAKYRLKNRLKGKCLACPRKAVEGGQRCSRHTEYHRLFSEYQRLRDRFKAGRRRKRKNAFVWNRQSKAKAKKKGKKK